MLKLSNICISEENLSSNVLVELLLRFSPISLIHCRSGQLLVATHQTTSFSLSYFRFFEQKKKNFLNTSFLKSFLW